MAINIPIISKFDAKGITEAESKLAGLGKVAAGVVAAAGAAAGALVVTSVKAFADFDAALNQSIAIMGDVSDTMRGDMADAARQVAKETTFSAEQAAESFFFLASAGLDAEASIAAMPQVAKFAQAGMFDMALATDLLTDAQSALGMVIKNDANANLEEMTRLSDVLVRANTLANASVEQFSTALTTKAGASLRQFGKDAEEGVAVLAALADQGIKGELAGTNLSIAIRDLTSKALKNEEAFARAGVAVFDSSGEMRNMADIIGDLERATEGMSDAQTKATFTQLGFSDKSMGTLAALMGTSDAIRNYESELRNAAGFTEDVAGKQLETFTAQLDLLKSGVTDVGIGVGATLTPALATTTGAFGAIVEAVGPKLISAFESIQPALEEAAQNFRRFVGLWTSGSINFETVFRDIVAKIGEFFTGGGLQEAFAKMAELRMTIFNAIIEALPGIVDAIAEFLPQLIDIIANEILPQMIEQFTYIFNQVVALMQTLLPTIIEAITIAVPQLVQSIADLLPTIINTLLPMIPQLLDTGIMLFNALVDSVVEILPQLIDTIVGLLPDIMNSIISMLPKVLDAAIDLFTALVDSIPIILPVLLEAIIDLLPKIIDSLISLIGPLTEGAVELFLALATAVPIILPELLIAIAGLIPEIVGALLGAIPQLINAGVDLLRGFAEGIVNNAPRILGDAIARVGSTLVNGVKDFLGINSPSKVFMEIGGNVVDGLNAGLGDGEKLVAGAAMSLSHTLTTSSSNAMTGISGGPVVSPSRSSAQNQVVNSYTINVNAGMGADGNRIGQTIVDEIKRFERANGPVFARA